MVRYILKQRVFLYVTHMKYVSARKCRRKFRHKFRDERVRCRQTIHNVVIKRRTSGFVRDKNKNIGAEYLTEEKLDDLGARLEHTPRKSLKHLAQGTVVSESSARTATQFLKSSSGSWCLVGCKVQEGMLYPCSLTKQLIAKNI
jgi:hypothetical protein